ncbi:MAG TPA: hypothetical protein DIT99_25385 [Candidatus Latescibacteria bacterium]|nr:hypothetical protein [Candidatus Latescibacterota bacterium]
MDSIIAAKTQWGGPGGGTHDIYLSLWGENGILYLGLVIEDREESVIHHFPLEACYGITSHGRST